MELIAAAAIKIGTTVYTGYTHKEATDHFGRNTPPDMEDGFMTTQQRFVDRMEAFLIAKAGGQLTETAADDKRNLSLFGMAEPPLNSSMIESWGTI
jgi:hypothetical protein